MPDKFIVTKKQKKKDEKHVIMTIRMEREMQDQFSKLAGESEYSRNELICMALRFALDHLEFIPQTDAEPDSNDPA